MKSVCLPLKHCLSHVEGELIFFTQSINSIILRVVTMMSLFFSKTVVGKLMDTSRKEVNNKASEKVLQERAVESIIEELIAKLDNGRSATRDLIQSLVTQLIEFEESTEKMKLSFEKRKAENLRSQEALSDDYVDTLFFASATERIRQTNLNLENDLKYLNDTWKRVRNICSHFLNEIDKETLPDLDYAIITVPLLCASELGKRIELFGTLQEAQKKLRLSLSVSKPHIHIDSKNQNHLPGLTNFLTYDNDRMDKVLDTSFGLDQSEVHQVNTIDQNMGINSERLELDHLDCRPHVQVEPQMTNELHSNTESLGRNIEFNDSDLSYDKANSKIALTTDDTATEDNDAWMASDIEHKIDESISGSPDARLMQYRQRLLSSNTTLKHIERNTSNILTPNQFEFSCHENFISSQDNISDSKQEINIF